MEWFFDLEPKDKITLIGILITAIMSGISLIITLKKNKDAYYIDFITKNKIDWINTFRENSSTYISLITIYQTNEDMNKISKEELKKHLLECRKIKNELILSLDIKENLQNRIVRLLNISLIIYEEIHNKIMENDSISERLLEKHNEYLQSLEMNIFVCLKMEWKKIKMEVKGVKYDKKMQKKDLDDLYKIYIKI